MLSSEPIISAVDLTRTYPVGNTQVVGINGIDMTVLPGELLVLKGHSGSGKSTLLSLLAGLDSPTRGRLSVAGVDLNRSDEKRLTRYRRETVGMIFQTFNLLPTLDVIENVCLPALLSGKPYETARNKATELLGWLHMTERAMHFPGQLSGGEMQRTAIARALINEPEVVLADEPTGNLDSRNGRIVIEILAELNRSLQRTVLIATHSDLADSVATRQIALKDGAVLPCPV